METLGEKIARARRQRSMSQKEVAEAAKISFVAFGRIERGEVLKPHPKTIRKIADALNVDLGWLNGNGLPSDAQQSASTPPDRTGETTEV